MSDFPIGRYSMIVYGGYKLSNRPQVKTPEELEQIVTALIDARNVCEDISLPYRLGGSTLLGIIRAGDIIPWSTGVTLHFKAEEYGLYIDQLRSGVKNKGFTIREREKKYHAKILAGRYGVRLELIPWWEHGDYRVRRTYKLPAHLFDALDTVMLRGERFTTFSSPVEYLVARYGEDWTTPKRSNNRSKIHSSQYRWER
jgi:hypothetical protein